MFQGGEDERGLSADARILKSPSLQQSFEFHAKTDLAHRLVRERISICGNIVHFVRICVGGEEW